jgi:hypothetical protein
MHYSSPVVQHDIEHGFGKCVDGFLQALLGQSGGLMCVAQKEQWRYMFMKHMRMEVMAVAVGIMTVLAASSQAGNEKWAAVKGGRQGGISGMTAMGDGRFLAALDNKKAEEDHIAVVEIKSDGSAPTYRAVPWPKDATSPVDLESITAVPGVPNKFLALESAGRVNEIELIDDSKSIKVIKTFQLPNIEDKDNYESIALKKAGNGFVMLWAHRGQSATPAKLRWGMLDLNAGTISGVNTTNIRVVWPTAGDVRHIAEMCIDQNDEIIISAASDSGDNGPFASALYQIGKLIVSDKGEPNIAIKAKPVELYRTEQYKIEGVVPVAGGFAVASDDENNGSFACIVTLAAPPAPAAPATVPAVVKPTAKPVK